MITVTVNLHTTLAEERKAQAEYQLEEGSVMMDLLKMLEIKAKPGQILLVRNGQNARLGENLVDGDLIDLIPALEGG